MDRIFKLYNRLFHCTIRKLFHHVNGETILELFVNHLLKFKKLIPLTELSL